MGEELDNKILNDFPPYEVDNLTKEEILGDTVINYLISLEDSADKVRAIERVKEKARELKATTAFNKIFKEKQKALASSNPEKSITTSGNSGIIKINDTEYYTTRYEMEDDGKIYEIIPNVGRILVCYHPIIPVERFTNLEDETKKIKLAYFREKKWQTLTVDKSTISSNQSIVKLADYGISVTSETAKYLVKYLSEIENLNLDKIPVDQSVSRLGWFKGVLVPYASNIELDNEKDLPHLREQFGEKGELNEWIDFFKERRKYNNVSRIVMAASVSSILLKKINQSGFTLHVWGESEYGKTVSCMAAESIFGNPAQDGEGVGINFNLTTVGLEYKLNLYNNIPLFINEMQHQKDASDYDKLLFLVSEGRGRTRSTKNGGIGKENFWNNVVITNGEKDIIKDNSNAGAYNRCISCKLDKHSYEDLHEVADFVKRNYGTPIREILVNLEKFDLTKIYEEEFNSLKDLDITSKQKILVALILTGDKILTDVIFKDGCYLTESDFISNTVDRKEVTVEKRAYEFIKDWYVSNKRHFIIKDEDSSEINTEIFGKEMDERYVAFIPMVLKKTLEDHGFDYKEVVTAWKRGEYTRCDDGRLVKGVKINGIVNRCVVLNMLKDGDLKNYDEITFDENGEIELPF